MEVSTGRSRWQIALGLAAAGVLASAAVMTGCQSNATSAATSAGSSSSSSQAADGPIEVTIDDTSCTVATNTVPSGTVVFSVTNSGSSVNEFEILAEDQLQIVTERENLTPGTTTEITCVLEPGTYYTASKTNMVGALVDPTEFTVTDSGVEIELSDDVKTLREEAVTNYTAYIKDQAGQLVATTAEFLDAYRAGNTDLAKELYPTARMCYERIEPTAESFGDIDPELDERRADAGEDAYVTDYSGVTADTDMNEGGYWTGWHAIELDLWGESGYTDEVRTALANELEADTQALYDLVYADDFEVSLDDISNGAISLLEEVSTSKITGEEEAFSHTDLYDFQANVEGAKVAYGNVKSLAKLVDSDLTDDIDEAFDTIETLLAKYNSGTTQDPKYVDYTEIDANAGEDQDEDNLSSGARELAEAVEALRVPLGKLTATILEAN